MKISPGLTGEESKISLFFISVFLKSIKRGYITYIRNKEVKMYSINGIIKDPYSSIKLFKISGKIASNRAGPKYIPQNRKIEKIMIKNNLRLFLNRLVFNRISFLAMTFQRLKRLLP